MRMQGLLVALVVFRPLIVEAVRMASRSKAAQKLAASIEQRLVATADKTVKKNYERYHKYMEFRGHKSPSLREAALISVCEFRGTTKPLSPPIMDLNIQEDIFQAAEQLMESRYCDDKLAGISLMTHVLVEHHVRLRKKANKLPDDQACVLLQSSSMLHDELAILRRVEKWFDEDRLDAWCLVDVLATGFLRKLAFGSPNQRPILEELFAWSRQPERLLEPNAKGSIVYKDKSVWKRRAPLIACVTASHRNDLTFATSRGAKGRRVKATPEIGDLLLEACSSNLRLGLGERFASTGAGWVVRYIFKFHPKVGEAWMDDNVENLTAEGVRYALEQYDCSDEYKEQLLQRCLTSKSRKRRKM